MTWDTQPALLLVRPELSQTFCPGCVSLLGLIAISCCIKKAQSFCSVTSHSSCTSTGLWTTPGLGASQGSRHRTAIAKSP